ncbi:G-patch domain-containing protein [Cephalotus follicularis]|uniref:G-patch domain-containing protein n=1 Tax=Cephalotus follicularis TaxID=3775 RepID=A0A1Q3ARB6_CEPFO|nr:G-patch domain-containing protein [Cephalotus follicularis]
MAGNTEANSEESQFLWDQSTQLYFHSSSGFYHDPNAGWYYSSRDGLYYNFEDGNYVLLPLETPKANQCKIDPVQDDPCTSSFQTDETEVHQCIEAVPIEFKSGQAKHRINQAPENSLPPSKWLEDTLIELYLSGYNQAGHAKTDDRDQLTLSANEISDSREPEEGEWIPEGLHGLIDSSEFLLDEGTKLDEENWQAQYGQVIQFGEASLPEFPVVDLWEWEMIIGSRKDENVQVARLVGRLVKRSAKLHPSMPSGGTLLKTAPICEVYLDLVRVTTGQVYKLRSPSSRYLASLPTYNSSNPTKDWGFPELSIDKHNILFKSALNNKPMIAYGGSDCKDSYVLVDQLSASEKWQSCAYRDRAAERRKLHGGFGAGPGQKESVIDNSSGQSFPVSPCTDEAACEALNISFGSGSYARRILEGMGWKEGEALGSSTKGLVEPIQVAGNIGNAGLGWPQGRRQHH